MTHLPGSAGGFTLSRPPRPRSPLRPTPRPCRPAPPRPVPLFRIARFRIARPAAPLLAAALLGGLSAGCEPDAGRVAEYDDVIAERDDALAERDAALARVAALEAGGGGDLDPVLDALRDAGADVTESGGVVTAVALPATSSTNAAHLVPLLLMPELNSLTLSGPEFDDDAMTLVGRLKGLERLDISGAKEITNEGFKKLAGLENLVVLRLKTVNVSDLAPVEGMTELKELDLRFSNVGDAAMGSVAKLPKLAVLKLERSAVSDEGLKQLSADQPIRALDLDTGFNDPLPILAEKFPNLQALELDRTGIYGAEGFAPLTQFKQLRALSLQEADAFDDDLQPILGQLTTLESLNLRALAVGDALMPEVGKLTNLKSLNLAEAAAVTETGLKELAGLTKLEDLDLWATGATDATMKEVVAKFKNLKALSLQQTQVGDEGLAALAGLENLERLDLSETQVTDESVDVLKGLPNLKSLTLKNTAITAGGVAELEEANPDLEIVR